jgi:hypothetical protein
MRSAKARARGTFASALVAFVALSAVGIAAAEKPVVVEAGNLKLTFNGGYAPKALPKKTFAPIVLNLSGKIQTIDGTQPAPLTRFVLEADENIAIDAHGYPTCSGGALQDRGPAVPEVTCRTSILGTGSMTVSVAFPEQSPIPATSELLVINGGTSGGKTTLYVHAYLTQPITTAIVTTVKITKIKNGRFGTKAVATVPPIANGAGSITSFNLQINKGLKVKGKPFSAVGASCPDRHLNFRAEAIFEDGTRAEAEVTRPCTGY